MENGKMKYGIVGVVWGVGKRIDFGGGVGG